MTQKRLLIKSLRTLKFQRPLKFHCQTRDSISKKVELEKEFVARLQREVVLCNRMTGRSSLFSAGLRWHSLCLNINRGRRVFYENFIYKL